jgi:hypothetical protein
MSLAIPIARKVIPFGARRIGLLKSKHLSPKQQNDAIFQLQQDVKAILARLG